MSDFTAAVPLVALFFVSIVFLFGKGHGWLKEDTWVEVNYGVFIGPTIESGKPRLYSASNDQLRWESHYTKQHIKKSTDCAGKRAIG